MFTTIEWDWTRYNHPWRADGMAIPVVDDHDRRALVAELRMDATGINNGWRDTMPIHRFPLDVFVEADDPRNSNPPLEVDRNDKFK